MDLQEQRLALLRTLLERTEKGELEWNRARRGVTATIQAYDVHIIGPDPFYPSFTVTVRDGEGRVRDEFSDQDGMFGLLCDLYEMARSGTPGPRRALGDILDALGRKDMGKAE